MPRIKGEGWRIEIAVNPKAEHKFVCENPGCGISYFNPNIFALHLEAHGLPEFSNTLGEHPIDWKKILILQSVQSEYESMSKSYPDSSVLKPLLAHLLEANPLIAQDFGIGIFCNGENINLLLEPSSCDRVQCMITSYLNSIRVCCRRNGRNEVSQEISGLAKVWTSENWSAGEMERKKQVTKLCDWLQLEQQRADLMDKQTWIEKRAEEIYSKWQGSTLHEAQENEQANQNMHAEVAIGEEEDDELMVIEPINAKVQDRSSQHRPNGHLNTHGKLPMVTEQNTSPVQQIQHNTEDKSLVLEVADEEPALPDKPPMVEMLAAQVEEANPLCEQASIMEPGAERLIADIDLNRVQMKECNDEAFPVADENTERMEDHHSGVMPESLIGADPEPTSKTGVHRRKVIDNMPPILCASLSYGTRYIYQHVTRRRRLILKQKKKLKENKRKVNRKGDL